MLLWLHIFVTAAMFHKRQRPDNTGKPPDATLQTEIADLFLTNQISGLRCQGMMNAGAACDLKAFVPHKGTVGRNAKRNLLRKMVKGKGWPPIYRALITCYDRKKQKPVKKWMSFMLPHECLANMALESNISSLCDSSQLDPEDKAHLKDWQSKLLSDSVVPVGLWIDGTPCNFDRSESLESVCWNLPGNASQKSMRVPITAVTKRHLLKEESFDEILAVVAWSFQCLADGVYPTCRHDGTQFNTTDAKRKLKQGKDLGVRALLMQARGDWKMYKETFRLPGWQGNGHCCYRCTVDKANIMNASSTAPWRKQRLSHAEMMRRILAKGCSVCPIFDAPGFTLDRVKIDWLHVADLGVAPDLLGNVIWHLIQAKKVPGKNYDERISYVYQDMQKFYASAGVDSQLPKLTKDMVWKDGGSGPKLRAKAAEARALVPWAAKICSELLNPASPVDAAIQAATDELLQCYNCLEGAKFSQPKMADSSRRFALQLLSLNSITADRLWRFKPKHHLFQELAEYTTACPTLNWTYRDEDFGGSLANLARSRGGRNSPAGVSSSVLNLFKARHTLPVF
jgi:hypothetical protein